jgi:hypothetical protein
MTEMGQSRLDEASCRSSHVRNAPLATVGPKKAACRDGQIGDIHSINLSARRTKFRWDLHAGANRTECSDDYET